MKSQVPRELIERKARSIDRFKIVLDGLSSHFRTDL